MSSTAIALNPTPARNPVIPPITAKSVGLERPIFQPIREAVGFLRDTTRFPDSSIPEEQRPSTEEHTISAMHRAQLLLQEQALDPKTITSILRKIMIHDLDEVIGREFHAVSTHANGTAVKNMEGFGKLTEKIALNTILVALLNADPEFNSPTSINTAQAQKAFPSLEEFIHGLRHEIKDITDNDHGVEALNRYFEKPEITAGLNPEWLSPDYRKAFESLKSDYLSMESSPKEQDSISSLIGKLVEKWDGIITTNTSGQDYDNPVPSYYLERKSEQERAKELGYTTSVMNRIVSVRDTLNILIDRTKELLKESLYWMNQTDGRKYTINDFPEQLGWMNS
ncbi:MAG: hypothetical protein VKK32_06550 [Candidatus Melainabacteria bacterium]|nr:hypothetical protein [Candidatus Melainabacteria bacterium]